MDNIITGERIQEIAHIYLGTEADFYIIRELWNKPANIC